MNRRLQMLLFYFIFMVTTFFLYQHSTTEFFINDCKTTPKVEKVREILEHEFTKKLITSHHENVPEIYFLEKIFPKKINNSCAKYPKAHELKFSLDPWQTQETQNGTFHLFNAYFDNRANKRLIRVIALMENFNFDGHFYCQLWYEEDEKPTIVKSDKIFKLWLTAWGGNNTKLHHSYIVTCPFSGGVPDSVSLVEKSCDHPSNNLRIKYSKNAEKKNFVVCVKGLNFPFQDVSLRLIEWIELLSILGADKISFYNFNVHGRVERVLQYYQLKNLVEVVPLTLLGGASSHPHLQNQFLHNKGLERRLQEVIPYNDCLYKHLQEFKFVVLLDVDEVIVPIKGTWIDLIEKLEKNRSSYMAKNVYFLDSYFHNHSWFEDIPNFMYMLQHVYRNYNYSKDGHFVKGFHNVDRILGLHNHYPYACVDKCNHVDIDPEMAHLQHYRFDCAKFDSQCSSSENILDTRIWNFKQELIERVVKTMQEINIFKSFSSYLVTYTTVFTDAVRIVFRFFFFNFIWPVQVQNQINIEKGN